MDCAQPGVQDKAAGVARHLLACLFWRALTTDLKCGMQIEEYRRAFKIFDRRKVGAFTTEDVAWVMRSLGQKPTQQELEAIINDLDVDGDGVIDVAEFMVMLMSIETKVSVGTQAFHCILFLMLCIMHFKCILLLPQAVKFEPAAPCSVL